MAISVDFGARMDNLDKLLSEAISSENPESSLRNVIARYYEHGFSTTQVVAILNGKGIHLRNEPLGSILVKIISEISSHIRSTQGVPSPKIQASFLKALETGNFHENLFNLIKSLQNEIDNGGLYVELQAFREIAREKSDECEDVVLDVMDII